MSTREDGWQQRVRELLDVYAATAHKMSDEALNSMYRECQTLRMEDLAAVAEAELNRRGLSLDECSN